MSDFGRRDREIPRLSTIERYSFEFVWQGSEQKRKAKLKFDLELYREKTGGLVISDS